MNAVQIRTNNHRRELVAFYQLPESEHSNFDYVTGEDQHSPRFVQYRGSWYDTGDCEGGWGGSPLPEAFRGWDNYQSDSFFSGVLFRFPPEDDYETVIVATYYA